MCLQKLAIWYIYYLETKCQKMFYNSDFVSLDLTHYNYQFKSKLYHLRFERFLLFRNIKISEIKVPCASRILLTINAPWILEILKNMHIKYPENALIS